MSSIAGTILPSSKPAGCGIIVYADVDHSRYPYKQDTLHRKLGKQVIDIHLLIIVAIGASLTVSPLAKLWDL